ncbi:hypothetical protein EYZ11_001379 [Aspergillus tanneri]|uniref:Uncharacterized protein n=1 Tax=Aspergillus tanneri TaxID=1220188 RepID=A0A4S3JUQ1_9EURO|nr:hypothetical protein EYZ11_001379 [Aspergillus tanneri]
MCLSDVMGIPEPVNKEVFCPLCVA